MASDASEHCIPCVSDHGCCFYQNRRLFYMQYHGLPLLVVCCFNPRDLPGICSIGFHWKKKIKGLKGRFKVVLMRILLWIRSLSLDAPSSLRGDGRCSSGLCWPKATLGVPQPEKCPPAQQHTQGPGIGARVSGSFRTSLCDLVKSSALSRLQFSQKQNGDNKVLPPGTVRG